jgi:probable rRNA maturation factor
MIEIQNEATTYPEIDREMLMFAISTTLGLMGKEEADITLRLTSDSEVHQLNQAFRGFNETTDVLSFNQDLVDPQSGRFYLGDILISLDRAALQAPENNHSLDEECAFLAIHGTLHLLGFDHAGDSDRERMWKTQDEIFKKVINEFQGE